MNELVEDFLKAFGLHYRKDCSGPQERVCRNCMSFYNDPAYGSGCSKEGHGQTRLPDGLKGCPYWSNGGCHQCVENVNLPARAVINFLKRE